MRKIKNIFKKCARKKYQAAIQTENQTVDPHTKYHTKDSTEGLLLRFDNRPYVSVLNPTENE